jgi:DNA recombination protein RmuC
MYDIIFAFLALSGLIALGILLLRLSAQNRALANLTAQLGDALEQKHRAMLVDLHNGLTDHGDRLGGKLTESGDRLRATLTEELTQSRDMVHAFRLTLTQEMNQYREAMLARMGETAQALNTKIEERLEQISGKVSERLDEGFKKTNETFVNVMTRLATIDEAQKKIENLTSSVVSLQEILGDKRSRGAFGEVQLEALVRNLLPVQAFQMQYTFPGGARVDCVLKLPAPTGLVAVDSKFPLENYNLMLASESTDLDRAQAQRQFKLDVRKHIEDISRKYIIPGVTSDGAVMFLPAEAVFAEIHAYHPDLVELAMHRRVWIVSPTTLMAVLNTARAVLKDVEMRRQVHIIKDELSKLGKDFARFDERMRKLADHVRLAHVDAQDVQISSRKITERFASIERVELEQQEGAQLKLVDLKEENKGQA